MRDVVVYKFALVMMAAGIIFAGCTMMMVFHSTATMETFRVQKRNGRRSKDKLGLPYLIKGFFWKGRGTAIVGTATNGIDQGRDETVFPRHYHNSPTQLVAGKKWEKVVIGKALAAAVHEFNVNADRSRQWRNRFPFSIIGVSMALSCQGVES
jgi:hypothetical protein